MADPSWHLWTDVATFPPGTIPICFGTVPSAREGALLQAALSSSWVSPSNTINFSYLGSCPTSGSFVRVLLLDQSTEWADGGVLRILADGGLDLAPDGGTQRIVHWASRGKAGVGYGNPNEVRIGFCGAISVDAGAGCEDGGFMAADYDENFRAVVIHEFGHVLGFPHEQRRVDALQCQDPDDPESSVIPNGVLATVYDPNSVMHYCRERDAYAYGYRGADLVTALDRLGAEMFYPASLVRPLVSRYSSFGTMAGEVVRANDYLQTDWSGRGASPDFFGAFVWRVDGVVVSGESGLQLSLSGYSGSRVFSAAFSDVKSRPFSSDSKNWLVDAAKHTAFLQAALVY